MISWIISVNGSSKHDLHLLISTWQRASWETFYQWWTSRVKWCVLPSGLREGKSEAAVVCLHLITDLKWFRVVEDHSSIRHTTFLPLYASRAARIFIWVAAGRPCESLSPDWTALNDRSKSVDRKFAWPSIGQWVGVLCNVTDWLSLWTLLWVERWELLTELSVHFWSEEKIDCLPNALNFI